MAKPTLSFGFDLSGLDATLLKIDRQTKDISSSLGDSINNVTKAMQNGLKDISRATNLSDMAKANDKVRELGENIKKAAKVKLDLDIENAKKNLFDLKKEAIGAFDRFKVFQKPLNEAIDFEVSIAELTKFVDFDSSDDLKKFEKFVLNRSAMLGKNVSEIISVAIGGAQTGYKGNELEKYTDMISQMKVAYSMSADEVIEMANAWRSNFGLNLDSIKKLGDVVNYLDNKMDDVAAKDIGDIMKRSAGSGGLLGLGDSDVAALASVTAALKITNEVAGISLNSFYNSLRKLQDPASKASEALNKAGISSKEFSKALKVDAGLAVEKLLKDLSKIDKNKRAMVLDVLLGSGEDFNTISKITGNGINLLEKAMRLSRSDEATNTMQEELNKKLSTTQNALDRLKSTFSKIFIQVGQILLPPFNTLLENFSALIGGISSFIDKYPKLARVITYVTAGFIALTSALAGLKVAKALVTFAGLRFKRILSFMPIECLKYTLGIKGCTGANLGLAGSFSGLRLKAALLFESFTKAPFRFIRNSFFAIGAIIRTIGVAMISNPLGLILAGIALAGLLIYKYWEPIKAFFGGLFTGIAQGLAPMINSFKNAWVHIKTAFSPVINLFSKLVGWLSGTSDGVDGAREAGVSFGQVLGTVIGVLLYPLEAIANIIIFIGIIIDLVRLKGSAWIDAFSEEIDFWKAKFSEWGENIKSVWKDVSEKIRSFLEPVFKWFGDKIQWIIKQIDKIKNLTGKITNKVTAAVSDAWESTKSGVDGLMKDVGEFFGFGNDDKQTAHAPTTQGALAPIIERNKQMYEENNSTRQINDYRNTNINLYGGNATPENVAAEILKNSYSFNER